MQIEYIRSNRKTLALEVKAGERVVVRMPLLCSMRRAQEFARAHEDWIRDRLEQQRRRIGQTELSASETEDLRRRAKEYIPARVAYFSRLTGLVPTGVRITSAKTRFGSCSGKNSVNFSLYLMQYSEGAVDYVVLHELCHIRHKNHGREFYDLISQYMPDYKKYVKELRK